MISKKYNKITYSEPQNYPIRQIKIITDKLESRNFRYMPVHLLDILI